MITLSASKLKTYHMCNRRYYYQYVRKVPTQKKISAVLGTSVHKAIEMGHKGENHNEVYSQTWDKELELNEVQHQVRPYRDGLKMLEQYPFFAFSPLEMELEFTVPFPNPAHPLCYIHGFIDQVYERGFIDLKTGLRKPLEGMLSYDLQFIVYANAFKQLFDTKPTVTLWHHLRTGDMLTAHVHDKEDHALRAIESILRAEDQEEDKYERHVGEACYYCDFRTPCLGMEN